jgi:Trp operon repressor
MPRDATFKCVKIGFEENVARIAISAIQPVHAVTPAMKASPKYAQIAASIGEVGIIEPPVVAPDRDEVGKFLLLDGHLRIEILKGLGHESVDCLISTDDEGFTYNRRVNRLAIVQEHKMILKAVERGVSERKIAKALNVDVATIRHKKRLLQGICPEAADLLKDKHVPINTFGELRKLAPLRQIEAAELMIAMNKYTINYAKSLVAATPRAELADWYKTKSIKGLTEDQIALMERESANLDKEFKMAEQSYGENQLDFVLAKGYLAKLLANTRIVRYLNQNQKEILTEFQKIAGAESLSA